MFTLTAALGRDCYVQQTRVDWVDQQSPEWAAEGSKLRLELDPPLYEPAVRGKEGRDDVRARARARVYLGVPRVCGRARCARARVYGQDVGM